MRTYGLAKSGGLKKIAHASVFIQEKFVLFEELETEEKVKCAYEVNLIEIKHAHSTVSYLFSQNGNVHSLTLYLVMWLVLVTWRLWGFLTGNFALSTATKIKETLAARVQEEV